jgi:transcription initiation factor TFIIB
MEEKRVCPECGDNHFFVNREKGEIVCKSCSCVVEESMVDFGRERILDDEDFQKKSRTGAPFDPRVANNLITEVGAPSDIRKLPKSTQMLMNRIRKKNKWTSSSLEQNLGAGLTHLKMICEHLKVPERVEKESARIFRSSAEKGLTRARSRENIVAACIYIATKVNSMPKTLGEICNVTKIDRKSLTKTYKLLVRSLNIKILPSNPYDFLGRFNSELKLDPRIQTDAAKIIEKIEKFGINSGKNPTSLAATALYLATLKNKTRVTQKNISDVSGITETTLRNRCKEMMNKLELNKREFKKVKVTQ